MKLYSSSAMMRYKKRPKIKSTSTQKKFLEGERKVQYLVPVESQSSSKVNHFVKSQPRFSHTKLALFFLCLQIYSRFSRLCCRCGWSATLNDSIIAAQTNDSELKWKYLITSSVLMYQQSPVVSADGTLYVASCSSSNFLALMLYILMVLKNGK